MPCSCYCGTVDAGNLDHHDGDFHVGGCSPRHFHRVAGELMVTHVSVLSRLYAVRCIYRLLEQSVSVVAIVEVPADCFLRPWYM